MGGDSPFSLGPHRGQYSSRLWLDRNTKDCKISTCATRKRGWKSRAFPVTNSWGRAPGTAEEINSFCGLNYQTIFPRFAKAKVNGKALPLSLYDWLKKVNSYATGQRIRMELLKICHRPAGQSCPTLLLQKQSQLP